MRRVVGSEGGPEMLVGNAGVPPWDRASGKKTDFAHRIGEQVVLTAGAAASLLGTHHCLMSSFVAVGIVRDARIVERRFQEGVPTFVCVTEACFTRIFLEYGETLQDVVPGRSDAWSIDAQSRDFDGRICVRIRPRLEGQTDDLTIVTDRRTYLLKLVRNPLKVFISLSWTYAVPILTNDRGRKLGCPGETVKRFSSQTGGRRTRYVLFELGPNIAHLVMRWADGLRPTKHWQLAQYRMLRQRAAVPVTWEHPIAIVEAVLTRLLEIRCLNQGELRQYLTLPEDAQPMLDMLNSMATNRRLNRLPLTAGITPTMNDLLDPFPFLAGLPETCFADDDLYQGPPNRARRIVWSMGPLAEQAALFCTIAPRYIRRPDIITQTLKQLASFERLAVASGFTPTLTDPAGVAAIIDHVLDIGDGAQLRGHARFELASAVLLVMRLLRRYAKLYDGQDVRGLRRLTPADPADMTAVVQRLSGLRRALATEGRASRKARVHEHAGNLAAIEFAADLNLEQIVITNRALKAAEKDIGNADWIDVPVMLTIVDGRGRLREGTQQCVWRIWNECAFLRKLRKNADRKNIQPRLTRYLAAASDKGEGGTVYEYRSTNGVLGSMPIEPYFVRCWRHGLIARPNYSLPARFRHKRHMVLRELKLPGFGFTPSGLLEGVHYEMDLWKIALLQNVTVAHLDPLEHALRFAHLGLSSVLENRSRQTAWLQQTQDQSGWRLRRLNKQAVAGFLAHDKLPARAELPDEMSWFPVGPKHQAEAAELVEMTCRRCGYDDGLLPEIAHLAELLWKRPDPQAWIFAFAGMPLNTTVLGRFLRFLLPGFGRLTYHDIRHLVANAALAAGVPGWIIRLCLNHASADLWLYYAQLSASQNDRLESGSIRKTMERSADARSTRTSR